MNEAGVCSASIRTRDCGGMDALLQRLEVQARPSVAMTISPSMTQRSGSSASTAVDQLGKVAGHRALVAAAQLDLVAVAEDRSTGTRPTSARRTRPAGSSATDFASIGETGGMTGRSIGSFLLLSVVSGTTSMTRGGSPASLGKWGGRGASPWPAFSCSSDRSSKGVDRSGVVIDAGAGVTQFGEAPWNRLSRQPLGLNVGNLIPTQGC